MAHNTKHHNSDADPASRHGRRSHAFKYDWYQHDQCTEEQAEWLIGFAPIFPDTCYHLTHYWPAAVDIPV
ncbi:hypothetical protein FVB16_06475, partial [Escherichia coli]|nr:hypothetical protein [Escherichia coli]